MNIRTIYGKVWTNGLLVSYEEDLDNQEDWYSAIRHLPDNDLHIPRGKRLVITKSPNRIRALVVEGTLIIKKDIAANI